MERQFQREHKKTENLQKYCTIWTILRRRPWVPWTKPLWEAEAHPSGPGPLGAWVRLLTKIYLPNVLIRHKAFSISPRLVLGWNSLGSDPFKTRSPRTNFCRPWILPLAQQSQSLKPRGIPLCALKQRLISESSFESPVHGTLWRRPPPREERR